jgi:hypothetical protein
MPIKYHTDTIITNDIYLAAYLLSEGYSPLKVVKNDRRRISFHFRGKDVVSLRHAYHAGRIFIDIRSFRGCLLKVRQLIDAKQRSETCPNSKMNIAMPLLH